MSHFVISFFFFNDTATTEIYTLSLHDALPISGPGAVPGGRPRRGGTPPPRRPRADCRPAPSAGRTGGSRGGDRRGGRASRAHLPPVSCREVRCSIAIVIPAAPS